MVEAGSVTTPQGIGLQDLRMRLDFPDAHHSRLTLQAKQMQAPFLARPLRQVRVECADAVVREPRFACANLRLAVQDSSLGSQALTGSVAFDSARSQLRGMADGLRLAGGTSRLEATLDGARWQLSATARALSLPALARLVQPWLALPKDWQLAGRLDVQLDSRGDAGGAGHSEIRAQLRQLALGNADGSVATDALGADVVATLDGTGPVRIALQLDSRGGQALAGPVLADFGAHPLSLAMNAQWQPARLDVQQLSLVQQDVARASGSAVITLQPRPEISGAQLQLEQLQFPGAWATLLQQMLAGTDFGELSSSGSISGSLQVSHDQPEAIDVDLHALDVSDAKRRLGVHGLGGELHWRAAGAAPASLLGWQGLEAYGLEAGASSLALVLTPRGVALTQPARIPIFDGALAIRRFAATLGADYDGDVQFEGDLEPISVARLSVAFGWPAMAGSLAGRIPGVQYRNRTLSIGGDLEARLFDGEVRVSQLMLQDPLGKWPRFNASLTARNLDLDQITHTFPIGSITGRLDADISGLELFDWEPVAFDAKLYTPAGDRSRHRISQRAVTSLSDIGGGGGGVTAALQSGALQFFKEFSYERIGLSCQLRNDVCIMDGIPRSGGGFYIVKGGGLPRIDITGNSGRVAWSVLLAQIRNAINNSGSLEVR